MRTWKPLKNADGKGGIRYREHPTRKHGRQPDRYYTAVYWWQGKTCSEGIGWASEKWTPTKCLNLLARIKENQATGQGPCPLAELREQSKAEREARQQESERQDAIVSDAWAVYIEARRPKWSERHYTDHIDLSKAGGEKTKNGKDEIKAGPLSSLMGLKLSELTAKRVETWAASEAKERETRTRLAFSLLRAFINWTATHPDYKGLTSA